MTWIRTIPPDQADDDLRRRYENLYAMYPPQYRDDVAAVVDPATGKSDSIVASHSLIPAAMEHAMSAFAVLLSPDLPLTRRQQEMIATVVSVLNQCFY
jgi:hypothetical protein